MRYLLKIERCRQNQFQKIRFENSNHKNNRYSSTDRETHIYHVTTLRTPVTQVLIRVLSPDNKQKHRIFHGDILGERQNHYREVFTASIVNYVFYFFLFLAPDSPRLVSKKRLFTNFYFLNAKRDKNSLSLVSRSLSISSFRAFNDEGKHEKIDH